MNTVITSTREPKNRSERAVWDTLQSDGWTVLRRGWPDFFCFRDSPEGNSVMVVEVKPYEWYQLKKEQRMIMRWMQSLGVKTFRGDGYGRLTPFDDTIEDRKEPEPEFDVELFKRILQRQRK